MPISRREFLGVAAMGLGAGTLPGRKTDGRSSLTVPLRDPTRPNIDLTRAPEGFDPWVEVIPSHLRHNVDEVRRLASARPILAVVKNNGYGLGLETLGPILDRIPSIHGFAVVKGEEALTLRKAGVGKPILLMGMFSEEEGLALAREDVHLSLYTSDGSSRVAPLAQALQRPVDVHLYLDTGMGRMGMPFRDALPWMAEAGRARGTRVQGTFTALTEDRDYDQVQLRRFLDLVAACRDRGVELGNLHAAASNGVFHFPASHLDLVRPGIALFGAYPSEPEVEKELAPLRPGVRFCARVVRVAHLQKGDSVSYGRAWVADQPTWVATLPVGHADGYPRQAISGGQVLINGNLFPVIGAVSASHSIVRLGEHLTVRVGDVATLMGPDHPAIEPNALAESLGVSVYDLLMHLNPNLPRIVMGGEE